MAFLIKLLIQNTAGHTSSRLTRKDQLSDHSPPFSLDAGFGVSQVIKGGHLLEVYHLIEVCLFTMQGELRSLIVPPVYWMQLCPFLKSGVLLAREGLALFEIVSEVISNRARSRS